jgi:hypothetical protein
MRRVNLMAPPRTSAGDAPVAALLGSSAMPHHRTRPMLVARGRPPIGIDRRLPCSPVAPAIVKAPVAVVDVNEVVGEDLDAADDRPEPLKEG